MRVGVNALSLVPGHVGGLEHYLRRLLEALLRAGSAQLVVCASGQVADTFAAVPGRLEVLRFDADVSEPVLAEALAEARLDLWWCPWVDWRPYRPGVPLVVTVPDLQHERLPQMFTQEELARRRLAYFASVNLAAAVLTFSEHTRHDLCELYRASPSRVHAIPLAEGLDWDASEPRPARVEALRACVGDGILYYPAAAWPHKGHATLFAAVRSLLDRGRSIRLVLTGHLAADPAPLSSAVSRVGLDDHVSLLGLVGPEDVRALYRLSAAVVVPSLFEGFGFPVLEAMRSGTPVVCADATSLPEVGGDAVLYFRPGDADALAGQIERVLDDATLRADLIRRGQAQAARFSWENTARRVAAVFEAAHACAVAETPVEYVLRGLAERLSEAVRALDQVGIESAERLDAVHRLQAESGERLDAMHRLQGESDKRLDANHQLRAESAERLDAVHRLQAESAERLDAMRRLQAESAERLDAMHRLQAESAERLDAMRRLQAESAERLDRINTLVAALRDLDMVLIQAQPRTWHGLSSPLEIRRACAELERARRQLQPWLSS